MSKQLFVKALVDFSSIGEMVPVSITWSDGRVYQVDRVLGVRFALPNLAALAPGFCAGSRSGKYLCISNNQPDAGGWMAGNDGLW